VARTGSAFLIDCDLYGHQYGITIQGRLKRMLSPEQRDCRLDL